MEYKRIKTDVLVIGGGVTGFMAAYFIPEDKSVTLLNTGRGASPFITGYNVPVRKGDSAEKMFEDEFTGGSRQADKELLKTLCDGSYETIPFLKSIGFDFDMEGEEYRARQPIGSSYPRVVGAGNISGKIIVDLLAPILAERKNYSQYNTIRIIRLAKKDGKVCGALGVDKLTNELVCFDAASVILCCGGFCKIFEFSTNTQDIGGDCIAMPYELGLPLVDMEFINFEPSGAVWPEEIKGDGMITTLNNEGAVIYNSDKHRFMLDYSDRAECVHKDELGREIYKQVKAGKGSPHGGVWYDCTAVPAERIHEAYEMFYQRYIKYDIDITKEPVEVYPAAHTSLGGVQINTDCSTVLPGLFVAGENAGGVHGANRIGGMAGLETQVFGKIAGLAASEYVKKTECTGLSEAEWEAFINESAGEGSNMLSDEEIAASKKEMAVLLSDNLNVIRNLPDIKKSLDRIKELLDKAKTSGGKAEGSWILKRNRLINDLETGYLFCTAAYARKETRGGHFLTDSMPAPEKLYTVKLVKGADGNPEVSKIDLN